MIFFSRVPQIYYIFHDNDKPSKEKFIEFYTYLFYISLTKEQYLLIYGEKYSIELN